ncbi:DUF6243 family protein [Nocardiopsis ansamitocini]|uniref:Uncharacterized protein n=1 Tax=Nocardiopsis ansamitocini TaxID=1670832 RepID=A0A9W6P4W5_9ACTN|nr:DUF6243 family protein [Nocardiopsis ansamitocini]GLU47265.1 hypothetical protein Nans01_16160 [Nocardiopsis ansamitocini]
MARTRNSLLGMGGQRKKLSRTDLKGADAAAGGNGSDPLAHKRELLEKLKEQAAKKADQSGESGAKK